ncbi:MAG: metallophosphoesterase, partial [Saprospiraceae bacterium]|nr:metallophosphoesterase [Saprospiraceae bacterium]
MPFFYVAGNHDMTNEVMAKVWNQRFGRTYYHFVYKNVLFLCLNSEDRYRGAGKGSISDPQYQYVKKVLETYPNVRHTLVFMHQPLWNQADPQRWPQIENILADRAHTVFVGHNHNYVKYDRNNGRYFILATTGGGSNLGGPALGQFDHVVWVTMKEDGPVVTNLLLDGILDEDVLTSTKKSFLNALFKVPPIEIEPYFSDTDIFDRGKVTFRFINRQEVPMSVSTKVGFGWDLSAKIEQELFLVPTNATAAVDVNLMNRDQTKIEQIRPVPVQFNLSFEVPGLGDVEVPTTYFIKPIYKQYIKKTDRAVEVDGLLDEWSSLRYAHTDETLSENQIDFDFTYDREFIYLAAQVSDDSVLVDKTLPSWRQDGFGWILAMGATENLVGSIRPTTFRITPPDDQTVQTNYRGNHWPDDLQYVATSNSKGYAVEIRLPIHLLNSSSESWEQIRINFFVDDKDSPADPIRLYWHPPWRSPGNIVGSGIFFKE